MEVVPTSVLVAVGAVALAVLAWLLRTLVNALCTQIKTLLKDQQEAMKKENLRGREEREYDNYLLLKGMQVISDVEHELVYCVIHGEHNGGLEQANAELDEFRQLSKDNLMKKASRWNIKIDR